MIPEGLTDEHFKLAAAEIERDGVPGNRKSVYYDLVLNGRKYPPKYVISIATRYATGEEHSSDDFDAVEAKIYFENRDYKITDRRIESVQKALYKILPEKKLRKNCLNVFSESIICADESGSHKWGLHLQKNKIRLLVGSIIVFTIQDEKIWMALDRNYVESEDEFEEVLNDSPYWQWDTENYPEYTRVPSLNGYYTPNDENSDLWNNIKISHFEFVRNVANKFESLQTQSQKKHEPELLRIIQDILGRSLPAPDHDSVDEQYFVEKNEEELKQLSITDTEREALSKSRIGQGKFRTHLKIFWKNSCAVTGCSTVDILRASHIKPWRDSENHERLDHYNGLLLTPNLDAAFDSGLISFDNDGSILIAEKLSDPQKTILGIEGQMSLKRIEKDHQKYLEYHRNQIFKT